MGFFALVRLPRSGEGYVLTKEVMFFIQALYTDKNNLNNPEVSPLMAKDLKGLPAALMVTTEFDILRDEDELYVERMRRAGVKVGHKCFPGQLHILIGLPPESAEIKELYLLILTAINENLNRNWWPTDQKSNASAPVKKLSYPFWAVR